jgi:RNA polymerase sigma-70 factor (ECF subfamily)
VLRFQRPVYSLVLRMVRDNALAEDLTQECFMRAFGALGSYDPSRKLVSWLLRIARNLTIDHLRRRTAVTVSWDGAGDGESPWNNMPDPGAPTPEHSAESRELLQAVERSLARLSPEYRDIFVLRFVEELSYEEIAQALEIPMGTVKTRIHRARGRMLELAARDGWGETPGLRGS